MKNHEEFKEYLDSLSTFKRGVGMDAIRLEVWQARQSEIDKLKIRRSLQEDRTRMLKDLLNENYKRIEELERENRAMRVLGEMRMAAMRSMKSEIVNQKIKNSFLRFAVKENALRGDQ